MPRMPSGDCGLHMPMSVPDREKVAAALAEWDDLDADGGLPEATLAEAARAWLDDQERARPFRFCQRHRCEVRRGLAQCPIGLLAIARESCSVVEGRLLLPAEEGET